MSRKNTTDGDGTGDRILSDFSTQPETAGRTHSTWALTVILAGVVLAVAPTVMPVYLAIPVIVISLGAIGFAFSATPPHLTPGQFARYRVQHHLSQRVFVRGRASRQRATTQAADPESNTEETDD